MFVCKGLGLRVDDATRIPKTSRSACHSSENWNPAFALLPKNWIPAFAGMTAIIF
jgi:hypothetical protein